MHECHWLKVCSLFIGVGTGGTGGGGGGGGGLGVALGVMYVYIRYREFVFDTSSGLPQSCLCSM